MQSELLTGILLDEFENIQRQRLESSLNKFEQDFRDSREPITEFLVRLSEENFVRSENLDYLDKDYMLVN